MSDEKKENIERCKYIADELELYISGQAAKCSDCGEVFDMPNNEADEDKYTCPHCKKTYDTEDLETVSIYDYLSDVYDIEYRIGGDRSYRSVSVMVAGGGPNIYIDTDTSAVELYWWGDRASYGISRQARDEIDSYFEEIYESR